MSYTPFLTLELDLAAPIRRRALVDAIAQQIRLGVYPKGARLPPVRALSAQLGVSKNLVQAAYDELALRGLIESRPRAGVFVARPSASRPNSRPELPTGVELVERPGPAGWPPKAMLPLSMVFIDPELLPVAQLNACFRSVLARPLRPFYDAQGHPALREVIASRLMQRGMEVSARDVIITNGSQQAIDVVARSLAHPRVAVEDPVYQQARSLFESLGASIMPLRLDPFEGPDLDRWRVDLRRHGTKLFYLVTSYQNPTGHSYSLDSLRALLRMSAELGFGLLEDDWGSDMLPDSEYRPTLRGLGGERVLYANSFTKKLLPSLRMGFLVAEPRSVPSLVVSKRLSTLGNAHVIEEVIAEFLERGYYDGHLQRLQRAVESRRRVALDTLESCMPDGVKWTEPSGGPTLWVEIPRSISLDSLRDKLTSRGIHIENASEQFAGQPHLHGFRIGFAFLPEDRLRTGIEILADTIARLMRATVARADRAESDAILD